MKDKSRITIMVCTSADSKKCPLAIIGKRKSPYCFRLANGKLPIKYKDQVNAWFDGNITVWWINNVFWPWHVDKNGDVPCILLFDNCKAHKFDRARIPAKVIIFFLPPNVTSIHQPADMGMIQLIHPLK